jgi:hypothetical protein
MTRLPMIQAATVSALLAAGGMAHSQQPPDVVQSDKFLNTAMGSDALQSLISTYDFPFSMNPTGLYNTAAGAQALTATTTGSGNTAVGVYALSTNTTGNSNTAVGQEALEGNTSGNNNTAFGIYALQFNTTGNFNVATGSGALTGTFTHSVTGNENTADGLNALHSNQSGSMNTAQGATALFTNSTGDDNAAVGAQALYSNSVGTGNTALGFGALQSNTIGGNNIAVGAYAGANITSGYRNIEIGNVGEKGDSGTIRIGTSGKHFAAYVAGISGVHLTGSAVYISPTGQLGVLASSERYKTAIEPMAQRTEKLKQLRPVTFRLKTDPRGDLQYGLIAEEVAKIYPELVIRGEKGRVEGVRYEELTPMLLNELQTQQQNSERQARRLAMQAEELQALQVRIEQLERSMQGRATEK